MNTKKIIFLLSIWILYTHLFYASWRQKRHSCNTKSIDTAHTPLQSRTELNPEEECEEFVIISTRNLTSTGRRPGQLYIERIPEPTDQLSIRYILAKLFPCFFSR